MRKTPIITIAAAILVAFVALGIYFATQRSQPAAAPSEMPNMNQPDSGTSQTPSQNQGQSQQQTSSNDVNIKNFAFSPSSLTVKKGATVKWTNSDDTAHTVIESDNKTGPSSPLLAKDQSYSFTYKEVGIFTYKCSVHPYMTGSVTVTE